MNAKPLQRTLPRLTEQRARRLRVGVPLFQLSALTGIPPANLSMYERGQVELAPDRAERLERTLVKLERG